MQGIVQNHRPPTSHRPQTIYHSDTYHQAPTRHHRLPTTYLIDNRPPTKGTTDHRPMVVKKPTTNQNNNRPPTRLRLLSHRSPTRLRLLSHRPPTTLQICFIYCAIFLPLRFYGTECPHMNGAGLNLPGKPKVIKIDCRDFNLE